MPPQAIEDKRAGRGEGSKEQQAVKGKLADLRTQFQGFLVRGGWEGGRWWNIGMGKWAACN